MASITSSTSVNGRSNITLTCDLLFEDVKDKDYDCIVIPGGPGTRAMREDPRVIAATKRHHAAGKLIGAICAAPTVLKEAGVLPAKYTAHHSVKDVLPDILPDKCVVEGNVITSTGAGTSVDFGLELVKQLVGADKRDAIAAAIAFKY